MSKKLTPYQQLILDMIKASKSGKPISAKEHQKRLRAIVNDDRGAQSSKSTATQAQTMDTDYMALCREMQKKENCTLAQAMNKIDKLVPQAREAYIAKHNQKPAEQVYSGKLDPLKYMFYVEDTKRKFKMNISQAMDFIDRRHPGLRVAYIKEMNQ